MKPRARLKMNLPAEGVREVVVYRELHQSPYQSLNAEGSVRVLRPG